MAFGSKVKKLCKRALRLPIMLEIVLMLIAAYCALNYAGIMCACLDVGGAIFKYVRTKLESDFLTGKDE